VIALGQARQRVLEQFTELPSRRVLLDQARRCVLADAIIAREAVPPFANSAMDGYALRAEDVTRAPTRLNVVGTIMAGDAPTIGLGPGDAVRIMTGAPLPTGADTVCMFEHTLSDDNSGIVVIENPMAAGTNVRLAGEDVAAGAGLFPAGTEVTPAHLGVLASLGMTTVCVHPHPVVGVLSSGDELVEGPAPLRPGKIRDANRPALLAAVQEAGCDTIDLGIVSDDQSAMTAAVEDAATRCDALIISGGVSVGDRDMVKVVLDKLTAGAMEWLQVAIRPAKPLAFGILAGTGTPVVGLPGNPVSAVVGFELFVRPGLRRMAGHRHLERPIVVATADADLDRRRDGKLHLVRVIATTGPGGQFRLRPSGGQGSHQLRAMAAANALALVPDCDGVRRGDQVTALLLDTGGLTTAGLVDLEAVACQPVHR
jgi:molybdopterin molybdotransferase